MIMEIFDNGHIWLTYRSLFWGGGGGGGGGGVKIYIKNN